MPGAVCSSQARKPARNAVNLKGLLTSTFSATGIRPKFFSMNSPAPFSSPVEKALPNSLKKGDWSRYTEQDSPIQLNAPAPRDGAMIEAKLVTCLNSGESMSSAVTQWRSASGWGSPDESFSLTSPVVLTIRR